MGEGGTIMTSFMNHPPAGGPAVIALRRGGALTEPVERIACEETNGFLAEAESFADMIRHGPAHWTGTTPAQSVDIALTLEALAKSARSGQPVSLPPSPQERPA